MRYFQLIGLWHFIHVRLWLVYFYELLQYVEHFSSHLSVDFFDLGISQVIQTVHESLSHLACEDVDLLPLTELRQECQLTENHASETQRELAIFSAFDHVYDALKAIKVPKNVS